MDLRFYLRIIQIGKSSTLIKGLRELLDVRLTDSMVTAKMLARQATKFSERPNRKPKFKFTPYFFTKLSLMPSVAIEVGESRSHIRKTCYGYREKRTGERVYLRFDGATVVEFRDSPCGYLIGTRYLIPHMSRMKEPRWDKLNRKLTRILSQKGIIVTPAMVKKYCRSSRWRVNLAKRLIMMKSMSLPRREYMRAYHRKRKHEEALKQVSSSDGVVRVSDSGRSARSKPKRDRVRRADH